MEETKVLNLGDEVVPIITPVLGSALLTYYQVQMKAIGFTQIEQSRFMGVMALSTRFLIDTYTTSEQKFIKLIYLKSAVDKLAERIHELSQQPGSVEDKRKELPQLKRLSQCLVDVTQALEGL